jgi:guanylate kinase
MTGNLIIISSPSGGGKGTLIKEVLNTVPDLTCSISYTTRSMRPGEEDGREYYFVSVEDFEHRRNEGEFIESATVHGNLYGTSRSQIERVTASGRDVIVEIDVQGATQILEKLGDVVSIFILPPSFPVLAARLKMRATESSGELNLRLRNAFNEVQQYSRFKYVVINEFLEAAAADMRTIIRAERCRTGRRMDEIGGILDGFDLSKYQLPEDRE